MKFLQTMLPVTMQLAVTLAVVALKPNQTTTVNDYYPKSLLIAPLPPYPAPELWAKDPLYFDAINNGSFDANLTSDVYFNPKLNSDFGVRGLLSRQGLLRSNPVVNELHLVRNHCPYPFVELYTRKANQLRQRHQAKPLKLSNRLIRQAEEALNKARVKIIDGKPVVSFPNDSSVGPGKSIYYKQINTSSVENVFMNPENIVKQFYLPVASKYHNYSKESPSGLPYDDFHNLLYAGSDRLGIGCLIIQDGVGLPTSSIVNQLLFYIIYNNQEHANYKDNIFPPGYFYWDKGLIVSSNSSEDVTRDSSLDDLV